jgi:hypothetical protein
VKAQPLNALTGFVDLPSDPTDLKKLALFFDHIYCIAPRVVTIKEHLVSDVADKLAQRIVPEIDYFKETRDAVWLPLGSASEETGELIVEFRSCGILTELHGKMPGIGDDPVFDELRRILLQYDLLDEKFLQISGTPDMNPHKFSSKLKVITLKFLETSPGPDTLDVYCITEPSAAADSRLITEILYQAGKMCVAPVFLASRHRAELRHRYAQYLQGLESVSRVIPEFSAASNTRFAFGEAVLAITNAAFSSDMIARKSPKEILKYRDAMQDARIQYVTHDLADITALIEGSPWSEQTRVQLQNYVSRKLAVDLAEYNQRSKEIWEKLFGDTLVESINVAKSLTVGVSAGSIIGNIMRGIPALHLLIAGAAIAVARDSPKIARTLVDAFVEFRKLKRSSMAYVAEFH